MGTSRTHLGDFQMLWDCSCGTSGLLGVDHRHCPNCGRPQDPKRRYFPDQKNATPAPEWLASYGADHYCPYCGTANSSKANFCAGCGGPMDGSKQVELRDTNVGESAETVQDAVAESRREDQERREAIKAHHASKARKTRERARQVPLVRYDRVIPALLEEGWDQPRKKSPFAFMKREREARDSDVPLEPGWDGPPSRRLDWDQYKRPALVTGILLLVGLLIWTIFFWEKSITVRVESRTWERSQGIEKYVQLSEQEWCSRAPSDRYNNSSRRKQSGTRTVVDCRKCDCHTERVQVGQTCRDTNCRTVRTDNGNGSFSANRVCDRVCEPKYENKEVCKDRTHKEPVYDDWCSYNINRWRERRRPSLSGPHSVPPKWPVSEVDMCSVQRLGCERPGSRRERYTVYFKDEDTGDKYDCDYTQRQWENYDEGSIWEAIVKVLGGRFQCDTLQPLERP